MASSKRPTRRTIVVYLAVLVGLCLARPGWLVLGIGGALAACGLLLRLWATGYLSKNTRLTREGPYRHLRHPLYFGTWLITTGFLVSTLGPGAPQPWLGLLAAGFQVAFFGYYLPRKERKEAARLERRFGAEFEAYRSAVPGFCPCLRPAAVAASERWALSSIGRNSEWGTQLAVLLGFGFLALRCGGIV